MSIGSEGGAEYRVTFEDTINPGDVSLLITHLEGLTGTGAALVAREVSATTTEVNEAVAAWIRMFSFLYAVQRRRQHPQ